MRADGVALPASAGVATANTSAATVAIFPKCLMKNPQIGVIKSMLSHSSEKTILIDFALHKEIALDAQIEIKLLI